MPGKLLTLLLDPTNSAEGRSTYKMFVFAGSSCCKLDNRKQGYTSESLNFMLHDILRKKKNVVEKDIHNILRMHIYEIIGS